MRQHSKKASLSGTKPRIISKQTINENIERALIREQIQQRSN